MILMILRVKNTFSKNAHLETKIRKFEEIELHGHEFIEFFYCLKGDVEHQLDDEKEKLVLGDAYFIVPGNKHKFISSSKNFLHRDIIIKKAYFNEGMQRYKHLFKAETRKYHLSTSEIQTLENLCGYLDAKKAKKSSLENAIFDYLLVILINKQIDDKDKVNAEKIPSWIIQLRSMLNSPDNFRDDLNKDILSNFGYSKEHIRRTFKKYIGTSIINYWNAQKMSYANFLLVNTDYQIWKICEIININNESYFYRLYKKQFNKTPKKFK